MSVSTQATQCLGSGCARGGAAREGTYFQLTGGCAPLSGFKVLPDKAVRTFPIAVGTGLGSFAFRQSATAVLVLPFV